MSKTQETPLKDVDSATRLASGSSLLRRRKKKSRITRDVDTEPQPTSESRSQHGIAKSVVCDVVLEERQTFSITHRSGDSVTLFEDEHGVIYPEKYRDAYEKGILKRK